MTRVTYFPLLCLFLLAVDYTVLAKIHSHVLDDRQSSLKVFRNSGLKGLTESVRRRRSPEPGAGENDSSDPKPTIDIQTLKDPNHNEAIVHWSGNESDVIFILTRQHNIYNGSVNDSRLWRSDDYGSTYKDITKDVTSTGVISYYQISPSDKNVLVFVDMINRMIYGTIDEGRTFSVKSKLDFNPDKLHFHPTAKLWVLAYDARERTLHSTTDLFKSYTRVHTNVNPRYFWAVPTFDTEDNIVHMEVKDPKTGNYMYKCVTANDSTEVMIDNELGSIDVDSLLVQREYVFVQKTTPFTSYLYVSHNRGPFKKAYFPMSRHAQDFSIVTADEHQVFIAANHHEGMVSLYLSDTTGQFYITSLDAVVSLRRMEGGFDADLYEVKSMEGTYIVNQHTSGNPRTLITFDQGGSWGPIQAPDKDLTGKPYNCTNKSDAQCGLQLHLHFSSEVYRIPYILSDGHAPGFILAHGVVGTELVPTNSSLFMSTNGGLTWKPIFDASYQYLVKILDQGAAMVSMPIKAGMLAHEIQYSSTEGVSWDNYAFKQSESFHVEGVINEPGINTLVVSIFGHETNTSGWTIIKMNFSSVLTRDCSPDDFETWYPSDTIKGLGCLLGQKMKYERKKSTSQCRIKRDYERPVNTTFCSCSDEDYECDYGYEKDKTKPEICRKAPWFDDTEPLVECPLGGTYEKSKGYRLVAADKCTGDKHQTVKTDCPLMKPRDVYLTTEGRQTAISTGETVSFLFNQDRGTKSKETTYKWNFGDQSGDKNVTQIFKGYDTGHTQTHQFANRGIYTVSVQAVNDKGSASATLSLLIEDHIGDVTILTPHGAQINRDVTFESASEVVGHRTHVHYVWLFGDEKPNDLPVLTWNNTVFHRFQKPGNYTVTLESFNNVGSVFRKIQTIVYGTLTTIQMDFSPMADRLNTQTELWREIFGSALKEAILDGLDEDADASFNPSRLEVVVLPGLPTLADVSVLPKEQMTTDDPSITKITQKIMNLVKSQQLEFELGKEDYGFSQKIAAIGATIVADESPKPPSGGSGYTSIYVAVPLIMVAIVITVLIVLYYRKKFERMNRYSLLEARSGEPDSLLDDTDDDDPPLDPNPDPREERLAFSDDEMDDPLSAHLRFGGGNTMNC